MSSSNFNVAEILRILLATSLWDRLFLLSLALCVSMPLTVWGMHRLAEGMRQQIRPAANTSGLPSAKSGRFCN